jgi:hypothetical protein
MSKDGTSRVVCQRIDDGRASSPSDDTIVVPEADPKADAFR